MAVALVQSYRYAEPSVVERVGSGARLVLATSSPGDTPNPFFFTAKVAAPKRIADGMLLVARVARTRFYIPPAMLAKILAAADPVVTCTKESVRFESFSACAGVYARFDVGPSAFADVELASAGTTNVDFNPEMRAVLAKTRATDAFRVSVGRDAVKVDTTRGGAIERKVPLPIRWVKSFGEVQAILASMKERLRVDAAQARKFFKGLPKTSRGASWVVRAGQGLRLSQIAAKDGVQAGGLHRLGVLADAANDATELVIYGDEHGSSAWELVLPDARFVMVLSPSAERGFSGEGRLLLDLAGSHVEAAVASLRAKLKWQTKIVSDDARALAVLASVGLVGYDLAAGAYFHRELPFTLGDLESLHPRLEAARKLLETKAEIPYRVVLTDDGYSCTCAWFSKHGQTRGPCKHVLARSMAEEAE